MNPNSGKKHLLLLFLYFLSIYFPGSLCQSGQEYVTCSQTYQCANITNISYPFWGGRRPPYCGHPGFGLNCQGDVPTLAMSPLSYRVLEIDFSTYTLKVAREDLWNLTCPAVLHDTTLNPRLFEIPPDSNCKNVALYFDCTSNGAQPQQRTLPNQFPCGSNETINLFKTGVVASGPGADFTCNQNISVPVNEDAALALENPNTSSISVLRAALASGFSIQWSADNANCVRSAGACGYNSNLGSTVRYTSREMGVSPPPTPVAYKRDEGNPTFYALGTSATDPSQDPSQDQGMISYININPIGSSPTLPPITESPEYFPHGVGITPIGSLLAAPPGTTYFPTRLILGGISIIIVAFYLIYWCCTRWCSPSGPIDPNVEKFLLQQGSLAPRRYRYSEIKKITKSFNDKLGQGGFGSVYKGMLPDGCHVAIKVLVEMDSNGEEFLNEVASISRTSHVNIVNLLGFCYERNKRALVFEYMPNRSLDKFINKDGNINYLDMEKLFKIVVGVAKGLEYLHMDCNTRIVHFDIKPQNILLDEDFCPKIFDFGLAKLCKKKQSILSVLGTRGTIGYIAPEVFFRNFGGVSHRSDVYSYGMMVLQTVGAKNIVEIETIQSSENYFPDKIYEQVILAGTRNVDDSIIEEEDERARKIYLVGFWCIQTIPSERPSMSRVVEMLEGSLQSIQIPPKPFLFDPGLSRHEFSLGTENSTEGFLEDV